MTIYVDDFHTVAASRDKGGRLLCYMISNDPVELGRFSRLIRAGYVRWDRGLARLDTIARDTALKLGAVPIPWSQCAAMIALKHMGEDMGEPETAPARRAYAAWQRWNADVPGRG